MVLEHLFPERWIEKKFGLSFFLGFGFTLIGVLLARLLFGANSGIVAVFFVSLLLIPSLKKLFAKEESQEEKEKSFTFKELWKDNKHAIFTYGGMFLGVYVATYLITYLFFQFGIDATSIFREQLFLEPAISGRATFSAGLFWDILSNNWWVLLACFLLAIISGDGATFFITWNASAWAAIFAYRSFSAGVVLPASGLEVAVLLTLIILPHMLIEGLAYILAGIAGAVISDEVVKKSSELRNFLALFAFVILFFWAGNFLIVRMFASQATITITRMLLVSALVWLLHYSFSVSSHQEVFVYNYRLFLIALLVFIIGAIVETIVLGNSDILRTYYAASTYFRL